MDIKFDILKIIPREDLPKVKLVKPVEGFPDLDKFMTNAILKYYPELAHTVYEK